MFFFVKKKLLSPTLYTSRLFSDGTDIDGGGVLPILRNNEMVKLDNWRWCPVDTVHWYWYQSIPVYWFWNQPYLVPQLQGGLWWRGWFPWQRPEPLFPCSNLQLVHQPGGIGQFDNEVLIVGRCLPHLPRQRHVQAADRGDKTGNHEGENQSFQHPQEQFPWIENYQDERWSSEIRNHPHMPRTSPPSPTTPPSSWMCFFIINHNTAVIVTWVWGQRELLQQLPPSSPASARSTWRRRPEMRKSFPNQIMSTHHPFPCNRHCEAGVDSVKLLVTNTLTRVRLQKSEMEKKSPEL